MDIDFNQYIRGIELLREKINDFSRYPFCLPVVKSLDHLELHPGVTFIIGENGTGKSTLLEAIATSYGFNAEGGTINFNFSTNETHSELNKYIRLVKGVMKPKNGFFLRAESFYNVATNIDELDRQSIEKYRLIDSYGGKSLHHQSHGESFLSLFLNRFGGNGLYILDEPEAALSPMRQMTIVSIIHDLVQKGSQFIISTHSPIIMAYPNAVIYELKDKFEIVKYEQTQHYQVMYEFLHYKEKMLDILMENKE